MELTRPYPWMSKTATRRSFATPNVTAAKKSHQRSTASRCRAASVVSLVKSEEKGTHPKPQKGKLKPKTIAVANTTGCCYCSSVDNTPHPNLPNAFEFPVYLTDISQGCPGHRLGGEH